jgi:hypothetical protein
MAVVLLHSGWSCLLLLLWALELDAPSIKKAKKRRFPFLKEAPFFLSEQHYGTRPSPFIQASA